MCFILKTNTNRSFPPKCLSEYNSHFEGTKSVYISLKTPMYRYQVWVKHFYSQKTIKQHNLNDEIYIYMYMSEETGERNMVYLHFQKYSWVSYKTEYTLTPYLLKWFEKLCPYKNLHTDACRNYIYNCQTWKQLWCRSIPECLNIPSRQWCIIHH